jgi:hypothetical protein
LLCAGDGASESFSCAILFPGKITEHDGGSELAAGNVAEVAKAINGIVAPAIMISASALIILALQGKYSQLIDRLRALNDERRHLSLKEGRLRSHRYENVIAQIEIILLRARLVRNSIVSLYLSIALFVLSSIAIGVPLLLGGVVPVGASLVVFMLGMIGVFAGVIYALRDIASAYRIALIEVSGVKELESSHAIRED